MATGKTRKLTDEERLEEVHQAAREFWTDYSAQDLGLFSDGSEKLDPVPVAPPAGYSRVPSMFDHMRSLVRSEMLRNAVASEFETFEESEDFDIGDDYDPRSPYEVDFTENETPYAVPREPVAAAPPPTTTPPPEVPLDPPAPPPPAK